MSEQRRRDALSSVPKVRVARKELPDVGELVIGTVSRILDHGAYVLLDEYGGLEAYAPINEVVQSWFHNIKDYLRVGQKTVFKVIRVDAKHKFVDVSHRRVSDDERKNALMRWKRTLKGMKLLELVAKRLNKPLQSIIEEVGWKLEDYYGDLLKPFEDVAKYGPGSLGKLGLSDDVVKAIEEVAREHIEVSPVEVSGIVRLINIRPNGVVHIRETLMKAAELASRRGVDEVRIYTIGPPRYRIDLVGKDPKRLEQVLNEVASVISEEIRRRGGEANFTRL